MVRSFTDEPVADDALARIVDAARRGPSAGYSQGVEFVLVTDPAVRDAVAGDTAAIRKGALPPFVAQAPALIVVCASAGMYQRRYRESDKMAIRRDVDDSRFWHIPYWHVDAGAALMLILLSAVDEGLGAGVAGVMGEQDQQRLRDIIGMPPEYEAIAIVAIGHVAPDADRYRGSAATRPRRARSDVVHRDRW
jgi:nitroreductase